MTGTFIVFEGPEGAGKSVQTSLLAALLRERGHSVVQTREPGGTEIGDEVRTILLRQRDYAMLPETEVLLLAAARAQHVRTVILPALARGDVVICDRYVDSTYAYQGGGRQMATESLVPIQEFATGGLRPDIRVLLDLDVEIGLGRRFANPATVNRIDNDDIAFHQRVRATYLELVHAHPDDWLVVDASASVEKVSREIVAAILPRIE
ncbi:MAG TPA: dTMP kinase [Thermomicrobiales bacterium]|nr:dTMP kinase [Thermomicrobiales bacterium]